MQLFLRCMQAKMVEKLTKAEFFKLNRKQQEDLLSQFTTDFSKKDSELDLWNKYNQMARSIGSVREMAQELKLNMDNVEFGMKEKPKETEDMIKKAYAFMKGK